jgi:outer membrane protein insertion porin family
MPISTPTPTRHSKPISKHRLHVRPSVLTLALVAALHGGAAWGVEPFVLKDIRIEGLGRTDAGAVFAALPFRVGDTYSDEKGSAGLRALFATGLFRDARLQVKDGVVVVVLEERATIAAIDFVGLKEFDKDTMTKALKDFGIGEGMPFDKALADRAEQELKRQYLTRSLYGAEVATSVTPQDDERVLVTFTVNEGGPARINQIRILGNSAFSESTLRGLLDLNDGGWMNWYTKADRYSRTKLNADLENLRAYYLNRGYLEFQVASTQVSVSPDKQDVSITITVKEGQRYTVTGVTLEGDYLGKNEVFKSLVVVRPGQPYQAESVTNTIKAFTDRFAAYGYAFARVDAQPDIDRSNGRVQLRLVAEPQRRVYVRRISIAGNSRTRDEVIRREFRQFESSWYDGEKIKLSRDRVNRLGYFADVNIDTTEVPGTPDQVDLTVEVKEKPTGNLMLGAGFSSAERFSLSAGIKQENAFGSGNYLGLELNTSKSAKTIVLSTVDPYFTIDGISRAIDLYYRTSRPLNTSGNDYSLVTPGASIRFGVPFTEYDTVYFGIGAERTEIRGQLGLPEVYVRYREKYGATTSSLPITVGWTRDGRDSALVPTDGRYERLNLDWGLLGDSRFLRASAQIQQYFPITRQYTLGVNAELGWGKGLNGRDYPIFKNFYGGGLGSVRAFDQGSLGPIDSTGAYVGGNRRFNVNSELYLPIPGTGNDRTLRWFAYLDAGNVWGESESISLKDIRASAGLGLSWVSPVGPLKFSYGSPIRYQSKDRIQRLQFQIGTAF